MTSSTKPEVHNARGRPSHVHRQHAQKLYIFWPCGFWVMACEVSDRQKNRHTHHKTLHRSPWTKQKSETEATNGRRYSDDCITQGEKLISARGTIHWCRRIVSLAVVNSAVALTTADMNVVSLCRSWKSTSLCVARWRATNQHTRVNVEKHAIEHFLIYNAA